MTNLNFKRLAVVALLLLGFSACNKEVSEPQYSETSQSAQPKTELIYLDMITSGSEEMRLAQKVDDATGSTTGVFMEEKDLAIQIAVRRKNGNGQIASQLLRFQKIKRTPRARYTGFVEVPAGTGNEVEIAGIVLGEWTGDSKTEPEPTDVKFMTKASDDFFQSIKPEYLLMSEGAVVRTRLPYIVDWTTAQLTTDGAKQRIQPITLLFKPSGTILRLQLRNPRPEVVKISEIKVKTNTFVEQWQYKFANGLIKENQLMGGELTSGSLPLEEQNYTWKLEQPISLRAASNAPNSQPTESVWLYTWVMGSKSLAGASRTEFTLIDDTNQVCGVFRTSAHLRNGQTMWAKINVSGSSINGSFEASGDTNDSGNELKDEFGTTSQGVISSENLPLSSIPADPDGYVMTVSGTVGNYLFTSSKSALNTSNSYYTWEQAMNNFSNNTVEYQGKTYGLPSVEEIASIFPIEVCTYASNKLDVPENIKFPGVSASSFNLLSDYRGDASHKVLYALRFKDVANRNLTAYRYEWVGAFTQGSESYLKVTSRFLGASKAAGTTIDKIARLSFWTQDTSKDVVRYFRTLGHKGAGSSPAAQAFRFGTNGMFWIHMASGASTSTMTNANSLHFYEGSVQGLDTNGKTLYCPVILFPRN